MASSKKKRNIEQLVQEHTRRYQYTPPILYSTTTALIPRLPFPQTDPHNLTHLLSAYWEATKYNENITGYIQQNFHRYFNYIWHIPTHSLEDVDVIVESLGRRMSPRLHKEVKALIDDCCRWAVRKELITGYPFPTPVIEKEPTPWRTPEPQEYILTTQQYCTIFDYFYTHTNGLVNNFYSLLQFTHITLCSFSDALNLCCGSLEFGENGTDNQDIVLCWVPHTAPGIHQTLVVIDVDDVPELKELMVEKYQTDFLSRTPIFLSNTVDAPMSVYEFVNEVWNPAMEEMVAEGMLANSIPMKAMHIKAADLQLRGGTPVKEVAAKLGLSIENAPSLTTYMLTKD